MEIKNLNLGQAGRPQSLNKARYTQCNCPQNQEWKKLAIQPWSKAEVLALALLMFLELGWAASVFSRVSQRR